MSTRLQVGHPAPDFEGRTQDGSTLRLGELRGKWIVLYFYPKDETPGCIVEACGFRDRLSNLEALGAVVVGVSRDGEASHAAFAGRRRLPFRLIADPRGGILESYGARGWFGWARRITFVIAPDGRIAKIYPRVNPRRHGDEVLDDLQRLRGEKISSTQSPPRSVRD